MIQVFANKFTHVLIVAGSLALISGCTSKPVMDEDSAIRASAINAQLGLAYMGQGNHALAMTKLKKSLKQNSDNADAHHYMAELYRRLGKKSEAEEHFQEALSLNSEDTSLLNNYGVFQCEQKKFSTARKYFDKVLADPLYKDKAGVYENIGLCAKQKGDLLQAEKYLAKALKIKPKLAKALLVMAQLSFDKQLYRQSRKYLYKYLEVAKHNAKSLWLGILLERRKGNKNRVASYAVLLKGKYPDSREAQLLRNLEAKSNNRGRY